MTLFGGGPWHPGEKKIRESNTQQLHITTVTCRTEIRNDYAFFTNYFGTPIIDQAASRGRQHMLLVFYASYNSIHTSNTSYTVMYVH